MQLQRYLLKNQLVGDQFISDNFLQTAYLTWYLATDKLGVSNTRFQNSLRSFICGLFTSPQQKLVFEIDKKITIYSRFDSLTAIKREDQLAHVFEKEKECLEKILEIVQTETACIYRSSPYETGAHPNIITFSRNPPSELYQKSRPIEITQTYHSKLTLD